jgi:indolepyruvate ferredoxin oxidoreductase beta subunit
MEAVKNILLVGVGGQGTILASKILSEGLMSAGYDVKMSEIHGMSQRGGSVSTQIRFGEKVYSPVIGRGEADIIVAFEKMEALRWLEYLKPGGRLLVNDFEIPSAPILMGLAPYPAGILDKLAGRAKVSVLKAAEIAEELGSAKIMNVVLLGALVEALGVTGPDWNAMIRGSVKKAFEELNIRAFDEGALRVRN